MAYNTLKYLQRAVRDALEAAGDLDPATVKRRDIYNIGSTVAQLQRTLDKKGDAAFRHELAELEEAR